MRKRGLLVVLSGPAGSGKSTLAENLMSDSDDICRAVTATTRPPRLNEKNGEDYFFLSREEFKERISKGQFLEYTEFNNNLYGTPRSELTASLDDGCVVLLVIDVEGSAQIRRTFPNSIHVFVLPPTAGSLRERLCGRNTECPEDIESRLAIAREEVSRLETYDYLVINDDARTAIDDLRTIIDVARLHYIRGGELEAWNAGQYGNWHA